MLGEERDRGLISMLVGGSGGKLEVWEFGVLLQDGGQGCGGGRGGRVGELEVWGSAIGRCESEVFLRKKCFIVLNSVRQNLMVAKWQVHEVTPKIDPLLRDLGKALDIYDKASLVTRYQT